MLNLLLACLGLVVLVALAKCITFAVVAYRTNDFYGDDY